MGSNWPKLGPSWSKLPCQMQALLYKFTRCGSHALLERNLAQHSANMTRKPCQNGGPERSELRGVPNSCFFVLEGLLVQEGPRGDHEGPGELQGTILGGFGVDFEIVLKGFWKNLGMVLGRFR